MLVYPPPNHETESSTIFFIGSAKNSCVINGQEVELVYAGNFCPVFPLEEGENLFKIVIDGELSELIVIRHPEAKPKDLYGRTKSFNEGDPSLTLRMTDEVLLTMTPKPLFPTPCSRICLDPGHGGSARGTCSPKGITEKELNLSLAKKIRDELIKEGFEVILTREEDIDLSLQQRVEIAKNFNSELFLSIHHNAIPDDLNPLDHEGLSVHYFYDIYKDMADQLARNFSKAFSLKNNGAIQQDLHVLRENDFCPALLIEFGYLIHPKESEIITSKEFQEKVSLSLGKCIDSYFK